MHPFVPQYHGLVEMEGKDYFKLTDVQIPFNQKTLHLMDVKMGVRCYEEGEIEDATPRADLYERMHQIAPSELSFSERSEEKITKLRWMTFRDRESSTNTLGFRIDGIRTCSELRRLTELYSTRSPEATMEAFRSFLPSAADCKRIPPRDLAAGLLDRLVSMRLALSRSAVFAQHEFIGTTLFFMADASSGRSDVWILDFGVTQPSEGPLKHNVPWSQGNHEDGFFIGLDNLIKQWRQMIQEGQWR